VSLDESIRYKPGDPAEDWLNRLLCLDATAVQPLATGCPVPADCDLYYVCRCVIKGVSSNWYFQKYSNGCEINRANQTDYCG
jgi:hypothetical protein